MAKEFKERVNYTIDDGIFVGYPVNLPMVICQADSLDELREKIKVTAKMALEMLAKGILESDLDFVQQEKHLFNEPSN